MNHSALIESFNDFKGEKNLNKENLTAILEDSFRSFLKKRFGDDNNFTIIVNPNKGDIEIWKNRIVVADEDLEDELHQISLSEARKIESDFEIGEEVSEEIKLSSLGRRAILAIRQTLITKIKEHDNNEIFKRYKNLEGEIISGEVYHIKGRNMIILDDEKNEMILMKDDIIPGDFYKKGDTIRAIIKKVEIKNAKPVILLSRTDNKFLEKLFQQEIPEILDGLITIRKIARIPGNKAKVAVDSYDDRIDPVGACVGMRGGRIHGIVKELNNENIDVINYTDNLHLLVKRALAPAKINNIEIDDVNKYIKVNLNENEVSKAIGKGGTNIKLASEIVGYNIDVYREVSDGTDDVELREFSDEIEPWIIERFISIGCDTARSILNLDISELEKRTDLEYETIIRVLKILKDELNR